MWSVRGKIFANFFLKDCRNFSSIFFYFMMLGENLDAIAPNSIAGLKYYLIIVCLPKSESGAFANLAAMVIMLFNFSGRMLIVLFEVRKIPKYLSPFGLGKNPDATAKGLFLDARITDFLLFNNMPDALSNTVRIFNAVASSSLVEILKVSQWHCTLMLATFNSSINDSIAMLKSKVESESLCLTPINTWTLPESMLLARIQSVHPFNEAAMN